MIDLDAIRARDAADMEVLPSLEAYAQHVDDEELRNAIHMVRDRRALLAHADALAAEVLALKEHCAALESREVCTVAHEDVETCRYCQRDALKANLASMTATMLAMRDQRERYADERDALRKDAERYRWLRDNAKRTMLIRLPASYEPDDIDRTIDAAMQSETVDESHDR